MKSESDRVERFPKCPVFLGVLVWGRLVESFVIGLLGYGFVWSIVFSIMTAGLRVTWCWVHWLLVGIQSWLAVRSKWPGVFFGVDRVDFYADQMNTIPFHRLISRTFTEIALRLYCVALWLLWYCLCRFERRDFPGYLDDGIAAALKEKKMPWMFINLMPSKFRKRNLCSGTLNCSVIKQTSKVGL